jgi:steroid delta-isomerase-like uncharacterized protein
VREVHEIAWRYAHEVWNAGRLEVADELFAADHRYHDPLIPELPLGPHGVRVRASAYLGAMPDARVAIEDWIEDADTLAARWTWSGTHTGEFLGMPPTGRRASTTGMHIFQFSGDLIAETWVSHDALGLLTQLGLVSLDVGIGV